MSVRMSWEMHAEFSALGHTLETEEMTVYITEMTLCHSRSRSERDHGKGVRTREPGKG